MTRTRSSTSISFASLVFLLLVFSISATAQKDKKQPLPPGPLLKRTTTRHETARLQYGGTVTLSAAPTGSVVIEGWDRNEVDVTATIELQAPTAADLDRLAAVNNFAFDVDMNHIRIMTTGTHDRSFMKRVAKGFPKALNDLPWKIDFVVKMPVMTDLIVDSGVGPISISGVEGALRLNATSSDADLSLTGGLVQVLIQKGTMKLRIPARGWHGLGSEFQLGSGVMTVELLPGFSADINADVMRGGQIKNSFADLQPTSRNSIQPSSIRARAGSGGATLTFTVGDGAIEIKQKAESTKQ
ncbi:MAG TPA: hypothetical protein VNG71_20945 [Pyrinomonadaceae bacterium]|nr:hypothetical protein [Pyrinomonadaceae bacterium]